MFKELERELNKTYKDVKKSENVIILTEKKCVIKGGEETLVPMLAGAVCQLYGAAKKKDMFKMFIDKAMKLAEEDEKEEENE